MKVKCLFGFHKWIVEPNPDWSSKDRIYLNWNDSKRFRCLRCNKTKPLITIIAL